MLKHSFLSYLGKKFSFRGCGWSKRTFCWSQEDEVWIDVIVDLFVKLFGEDYLNYTYSKDHGTQVTEVSDPRRSFIYDHDKWEESFETVCQERAVSLQARRSASLLKQLADTTVKQPEAESNDLDGVAPLQSQPLPCVSNSDELKTADVPVLHCSDAVVEASSLPGTETRHSSNDVEEVARSEVCSPVAPLVPRCRKKLAIKHGLPLSISALFQISATGIFQGPESAFVDNLMDGSVVFEGSKVIDSRDLVALRGGRPTSEENYLTNFVIESYLDLIAKQGALQGSKVECIGWECFEKAVGRQPAKDVLTRNAPLLQQDIVLVPCNSENSRHWFLLALLPKQFQILVLDSTAGSFIKPTAKKAITKMWMLLNELDATIDASHWKFIANKPTDIPQQQNDFDCGVYVCMYARCLALQHLMPDHIPSGRKIMILELHQGQLHPYLQ